MKSVKCNSCGFTSLSVTHCKKCGKPIERTVRKFDPASAGSLVWRDENKLVVDLAGSMPDRCVICNRSADGKKLELAMPYNHQLLKTPLLVGVAAIRYKELKLPVGLCNRHLHKKLYSMVFGVLFVIGGIIISFCAMSGRIGGDDLLIMIEGIFAGIVACGVGLGLFTIQSLAIATAKETRFWIKGASKSFLETLPPYDGSV